LAVSLPTASLLPSTTYYFAAEVFSNSGRALGATLSFTTLSTINAWRLANLGTTSNTGDTADGGDSDKDGESNFSEFVFGTNPASGASGSGALVMTGGLGGGTFVRGKPIALPDPTSTGSEYRAIFVRRKDHVAAGLRYIPKLSSSLVTWDDSTVTPTVLADDGTYQAVSVPFRASIGGETARFFTLTVEFVP
jgi:hypothetical protein